MNKPVSISSPGQLTILAALVAGLAAPGLVHAADSTSKVVISQVYGGGGNSGATYTNDFIELFNRSSVPVSLAGMSVQYGSSGGTTWTNKTDLSSVTLQPGQYYLISENSNAAVGVALPTPDQSANIAMAAGAGKVALTSNNTALTGANPVGGATVLDFVGYGAANGYETAPTATISATTSAQRALNGCTDTDNNSADFTVLAVKPRNSATPVNACGAAPAIIASCPQNVNVAFGIGGSAPLSASDTDSKVNGASIASAAVAGISLTGFNASSADGATASVTLNVDASTAKGNYPVIVKFVNDDSQEASCTVTVNVAPPAATSLKIYEIQGSGAASQYNGTIQTTEGVVTAKVSTGFFIQDAVGDNDPTTSDAVYVYTGSTAPTVAINDVVRVTATVQEYTPTGAAASLTELVNPTITKIGTSAGIAPTNITLPIADFGPYQGMLVRFAQPLTASQVEFVGDRGEISLSSGRLETTTNRFKLNTPEELALRAANARNIIVLDDGIFVTPTVIPYIAADKTIRAGDTTTDLTGVIDLNTVGGTPTKSLYKLQPTLPVTFSRDNPRPTAPSFAAGNVKVASANVLNFFTTFTNGTSVFDQASTTQGCTLGSSTTKSNCRGADNLNEFTRQRDKIVNSLKLIDADLVGLMEIQNNGETAVTYLVDQLNAAYGQPVYAVVPKPSFTGTDAIRVAMIYKPAKLTLSGAAITDPDPAGINNRPPMAQTFVVPSNGGKFSLIVNHLKSKGSCPSSGETDQGEGCWTPTRVAQAGRLINNFIPQVQAASGDQDVLLIGDFNSYGMEAPINLMTDAGIVNQLERYVRPIGMPYSYVFNSTSGYLDHALATPSMSAQVSGASEFHNNADEPSVIDYNLDGKPQDLYVNNAYRASDHDPVTITLNIAGTSSDVSGSFSTYRSALANARGSITYTGNITLTNTSGAAVSGPLQLELNGLPSGVTLSNATGVRNGVPYITVNSASVAAGASVVVNLVFSNPSKGPMGYTTTISSGTF